MRKIIDIPDALIPKLKLIAAIEDTSVKKLMEKAIAHYVKHHQNQRLAGLATSEKEDLGMLLLMQQASVEDAVDAAVFLKD